MTRVVKTKELVHTRLANNYGGWIYCESCNKTIGYLCYVSYDELNFDYKCKCGGCGSMHLSFKEKNETIDSGQILKVIKNRLCCPNDNSPLLTVLSGKLECYKYEVICTKCNTKFVEEQTVCKKY